MAHNAGEAIREAHAWFERNSGWAPPGTETLVEWMADGVCRCPDDCLVAPFEWCEHGLASWWLILEALEPRHSAAVLAAHDAAERTGDAGYTDPTSGLFVMTAQYLRDRGSCCDSGCRHCPWRSDVT